jgi:hypothetical protein
MKSGFMVSPCQCGAKRFWLGFLRDLLGTFFRQNIYYPPNI